ncbi:MAG: HepT-like ribonuclease domain-containing protein [Thermoprotei archaeon]
MSVNKEYINKLVEDVRDSIKAVLELTVKPYEQLSDTEKYVIRYHLIVIAEAITSLVLHVVRRVYGVKPETPIHALRLLRDKNIIGDNELNDLISLLRLRNLLEHRYRVIDDKKIYENVKRDFRSVDKLIEEVSGTVE